MTNFDFPFVLLHLSALLIIFLLYLIMRLKRKSQIHYVFIFNLLFILIWSLGQILEIYTRKAFGHTIMIYISIYFFGVCFLPISILFTGLIFAFNKIKFSKMYLLLIIPPLFSYIILLTNKYHNLFFVRYSPQNSEIIYGKYFFIHNIQTYLYIVIGLYFLVYFSIRNSGFFSKQSIFIFLGILIPFSVNILITYKIMPLPTYFTPIAFLAGMICFMYAIMKYNLFNVVPIALQFIVDRISDCFIVINEDYEIIDFNKPLLTVFDGIIKIKRRDDFFEFLANNDYLNLNAETFNEIDALAKKQKKPVSLEIHIEKGDFDRYFSVEITPIILNESFIGTIILLKDITQSKIDLETIKENQAILMEQERLASLGQLAGGIAHNLRTPIMSLAGGIEALKDLTNEYRESIGDNTVTIQDHLEIADEMNSWLEKMKPYCSYMSDIISAVKGQTVQKSDFGNSKFTVEELVKRIDLLMRHELKRYHCNLEEDFSIDMNTEIRGEVNSLVQIFDNIIINAIHAYEGNNGTIEFKITRSGDNVEFVIRDFAKGIPEHVKDRLFKEMVTTKGKNGTGLGLYMSYSTIKGRFGGNMWFTSKEGSGTSFYITIPCLRPDIYREVASIEKEKHHTVV